MTLPVEQFSYLSWMKSDLRIEEFSVESLQVTPLNISAKVWFNELDRVVLEMHISRMFQFEKLWYSAVKFTETCRDKIKSNYTCNIKLAPKIIIYKKKFMRHYNGRYLETENSICSCRQNWYLQLFIKIALLAILHDIYFVCCGWQLLKHFFLFGKVWENLEFVFAMLIAFITILR